MSRERVDGLLGGSCRGATSFPNKAVMSKKGASQSVAPRPSEAQRGTSHLGILILVHWRKSRKREIEGTPRKRGPTWRNGVRKGQQAARDYGMDSKAFSSLACRSIQTAPRLPGETQPGWSKHRLGWAGWLEPINEPDVKTSRTAPYGASRSSCWC